MFPGYQSLFQVLYLHQGSVPSAPPHHIPTANPRGHLKMDPKDGHLKMDLICTDDSLYLLPEGILFLCKGTGLKYQAVNPLAIMGRLAE